MNVSSPSPRGGSSPGGAQPESARLYPDVIIGHHGWGELLDIKDVYPTTPLSDI